MNPRPEPKFTEETEPVGTTDSRAGLALLVLGAGPGCVHPLPAAGEVTLGRSDQVDIQLPFSSVSRIHATLVLEPELAIRDEGSANGVWVRSRRVSPGEVVPLAVGEPVELGTTVVVVHRPSLWPHGASVPTETVEAGTPAGIPIVRDEVMVRLYALVERVARSDLSVLLLGETGVGKEVVASAIHCASPRSEGRFVRLNCAALPANLIESELFGHERGAFTGADRSKRGLLEAAHGGTVMLDEVGELGLDLQAKLLRVLEEQSVRPVGGLRSKPIDVRFIAATNRDLVAATTEGRFRPDLYYRLNGMTIAIPPLRERTAEIAPLAEQFASEARQRLGQPGGARITKETLARLQNYPWPGNIRELRNAIEHAVLVAGSDALRPCHLPADFSTDSGTPIAGLVPTANPMQTRTHGLPPLGSAEAEAERQRVLDALDRCTWNQTRAAQLLGVSRRTLVNRLDAFGIPRPRKRRYKE